MVDMVSVRVVLPALGALGLAIDVRGRSTHDQPTRLDTITYDHELEVERRRREERGEDEVEERKNRLNVYGVEDAPRRAGAWRKRRSFRARTEVVEFLL